MSRKLRFQVGGTVPSDGYVYVARPEEKRFLEAVREGRWCTVSGCRTMGKSSLVTQYEDVLRSEDNCQIAYVDIAAGITRGITEFGEWIAELVAALRLAPASKLKTIRASKASPIRILHILTDLLLGNSNAGFLLILDEMDVIASLRFKEDILAAFKAFQAQQARDPELRRLVFCFVGLRPFYELADPTNGAASPLGESIHMEDFPCDEDTIEAIAAGFPSDLEHVEETLSRILYHTGGQPYLTIYLADQVARAKVQSTEEVDRLVDVFLQKQRRRPMELLRLIQEFILSDQSEAIPALSTYLGLREGRREARTPQAPGADLLLLSGLVRTGDEGLEIKSPLLKRHFTHGWAEHMQAKIGTRETASRPSHAARRASTRREHIGKICVLDTGGTIGMFEQPDGTVRPPKDSREFLARYRQITELADITFVPLFNLDSVNVYPPQWATIAKAIYDRSEEGYGGFVVAHGTDTMAFTASAVAFALGKDLYFPVVFTGSQTTVDVPHGDALSNLYRACMVALEQIPEVVIAFGEYVFRAVRAQKKNEERFDAFESPNYPPLAYVGETVEVHREFVRGPPGKSTGSASSIHFQEEGILLIFQYPGLDPEFFMDTLHKQDQHEQGLCRGVVIQTSGAGNVSSRLPFSYVPFLAKAQQRGIPVIITSQYPGRRSTDPRFQTASWPLKYDAIPVGNITAPAAVTKFHWVLGQVKEKAKELSQAEYINTVRTMMQTDYVGEIEIGEREKGGCIDC